MTTAIAHSYTATMPIPNLACMTAVSALQLAQMPSPYNSDNVIAKCTLIPCSFDDNGAQRDCRHATRQSLDPTAAYRRTALYYIQATITVIIDD
eukprot:20548-Heterococcus_DN1.PRE.1